MANLERTLVALFLLTLATAACTSAPPVTPPDVPVETARSLPEHPLVDLPLTGEAAEAESEISGMTWWGDYLVLLPQYPKRKPTDAGQGKIFLIARATIDAAVAAPGGEPIAPEVRTFAIDGVEEGIGEFEGFESIVFTDDTHFFVTVEAERDKGAIGFFFAGKVAEDGSFVLDPASKVEIPGNIGLENLSYEAAIHQGGRLVALHEGNGSLLSTPPVAQSFDEALAANAAVPMPVLEYRITDATEVDSAGSFWVINYLWKGDKGMFAATDPLVTKFGQGPTHAEHEGVERLIEMTISADGVALADRAPIYLPVGDVGRNWEGLVRHGDGFLIVTDKFPTTQLVFVSLKP